MDRRTLLETMVGRSKKSVKAAPSSPPSGSFSPFSGSFTFKRAAHLLRRTTFGPTKELIQWSAENGLDATIEKLFTELPLPNPPVYFRFNDDPYAKRGQTWVDAPLKETARQIITPHRRRSLLGWTVGLMMEEGISIREKLTLFWHNHFPINDLMDFRFNYRYITTLRKSAWGNFRELTKEITVDPGMLRYLNGNTNKEAAPNENYARELMELFTIGKGPLVGEGDYTNYTEQDVKEAARVLTGWTDFGYNQESDFGSEFVDRKHDTGVKKFSPRFGNAEISDAGDKEYMKLIDMIFQQKEVARFICRRLYRWFVYYEIDDTIEATIIEPMAQILYDADFEIKPALMALLKSEHFFDDMYLGAMIKNPFDLIMSAFKPLGFKAPSDLDEKYDSWYSISRRTNFMQMNYYEVPQVAGWRAYYIAPFYYRDWVNSSTLGPRMEFCERVIDDGFQPNKDNGPRIKADVMDMTSSMNNPLDPNDLIMDLCMVLLSRPLRDEQLTALKEILIPGLPDFEWTVEYGNYLDDPSDSELALAVEAKLTRLYKAILTMPEFQLG